MVISDPARQKYRKAGRVLTIVLASSGLAVWLYCFHVSYVYDETRPPRGDAASGRIYPHNNHGHVVYLTKEEDNRLTKLRTVAFSLLFSGLLVGGYFARNDSSWQRRPKPWETKRF